MVVYAGESAPHLGVNGSVNVSPSCPGPQKINQEPCSSPLPAVSVVLLKVDGRMAGRATTAADGSFFIVARSGNYTLHVEVEGMYPRCPGVAVKVAKNSVATANILCESGMR